VTSTHRDTRIVCNENTVVSVLANLLHSRNLSMTFTSASRRRKSKRRKRRRKKRRKKRKTDETKELRTLAGTSRVFENLYLLINLLLVIYSARVCLIAGLRYSFTSQFFKKHYNDSRALL
jgi:hypothetical protein